MVRPPKEIPFLIMQVLKKDLLSFVCDGATAKQGQFMPGSHIPILPPENLKKIRADYILILPWNISKEIKKNKILT